jgi:hypothetical protein
MSSPGRTFLVLAALSGAIAVIAAAYAAHGPVVSGRASGSPPGRILN